MYDSRIATIAKSIDVLIENVTSKMFVIEVTKAKIVEKDANEEKEIVAKTTKSKNGINCILIDETTKKIKVERDANKAKTKNIVDATRRRENITTRTFVIQKSKRRENENAKTTARI